MSIISLKSLKNNYTQLYHLVSAAILTLIIIFVLGVYDHGETARAAMFIYPFLLIPVAIYIKTYSGRILKSDFLFFTRILFKRNYKI
ncbi:MAG: hypothetical protein P8Y97_02700 [Candidatus Lokiarchaeota archaeon]